MQNISFRCSDADLGATYGIDARESLCQFDSSQRTTELTPSNCIPWGIAGFDRLYGGIAAGGLTMLSTPEYDSAIAAVGHYLARSLEDGQRATIVSFDKSSLMLAKLAHYGFDFKEALQLEKLVYLYYKPTFLHALSCSTDYAALFKEILTLSGPITRLAFLNADMLFNLQTEYLARVSASKLASAFGCESVTTLGCFVRQHLRSYQLLDAVCNSQISSYIRIRRKINFNDQNYAINWRREPDADANTACSLDLKIGHGYVSSNASQSKIA